MPDLQAQFDAAAASAKSFSSRPDNSTLLQMYALYKQATAGDVSGSRPGMFDLAGGAKYDAWSKLKGTGKDDAMQKYIDLIKSIGDKA